MQFTPEKIIDELYAVYIGATKDGAWAPALRALEQIGRHIGMWRAEASQTTDISQLIVEDPLAGPPAGPLTASGEPGAK